jgi:hypothetical protein
MRRSTIVGVGIVALLAVGLGAAALRGDWFRDAPSLARDERISASAVIAPRTHMFGDTVTAQLDLVFSRIFVPVGSVRVRPSFKPYDVNSSSRSRTDHGKTTRLTYVYRLSCLTRACVPSDEGTTTFPPAVVSYTLPGFGGPSRANVAWPTVTAAARVSPAERERPELRATVRPLPAPTYSIQPTRLAALSLAGALALVLLAAALLAPALPRSLGLRLPAWARRRTRPVSPLERALARVQAAEGSGNGDERRALEHLAVELAGSGEAGLARAARRLAWSPGRPPAAGIGELSSEVKRLIGAAR